MRIVSHVLGFSLTDLSQQIISRFRLFALIAFVFISAGAALISASSDRFRRLIEVSEASDRRLPSLSPDHKGRADVGTLASDAQLKIARHGQTATLLNDGKVLITGGENENGPVSEAEVFDPATSTFFLTGTLDTARADHTASLLADGRVLVTGGHGSAGLLGSTEIFDPASGAFTAGPPLHSARAGQTATTLTDGRILIAGGDAAGSVEIYDTQANRFTLVDAHLNDPRSFHSAAPFSLQAGEQRIEKVLVAGGSGPDGISVKTGEIFDVGSSTFSLVNNELTDEHIRALLRVLPDSKVQIIGGSDHEVMEIYDPATNQFGGHVHVYPTGDDDPALVQEILDAPTRMAMFRLGAPNRLLNRERQTITEMTGLNQALVVGGVDAEDNSLASASVLNSSPASVTTDKLDYAPRTPVVVSGTGWQPHEVVTIMFHEDPHKDTDNRHTFSAQTDANGAFVCEEYAPEGQDAGVHYLLAAKGVSSGWTAQTAFTDATDPVPQSLSYSQDFSGLAATSTAYPAGWQGWIIGTGSTAAFRTNAATADAALIASSSASNNSGGVHNYNGKPGFLSTGSIDSAIALSINTTGTSNVKASFDVMTIRNPYDGGTNTRINEVDLQFRVGTSGGFTSVSGNPDGIYQNNTTTQIGSGVTAPQNSQSKTLTLPAACDNQAVVQLRWVQRDLSGGGSRPSFAVDNVLICPTPPVANAGPDQEFCESSTASLSGNTPATGSGLWTLVSGSGAITSPGSPNSGVTNLGYGTNVFRWTITNGSCNSSIDDVTVKRDQTPTTANAGPDQQVCSTSATFAGSAPAVGDGTWTLVSGSGTITNPSSPVSGVTNLGTGANTFRWTIRNGVCDDSFDDVTITLPANSPPAINSFTAGTASAPSSSIIDFINASTGDTLVLGATAGDPDAACGDSVASYIWTVNGHTTTTPENSLSIDWPTLQSIHSITSAGTYVISVTAKDTHDALSPAANGTLTVYQNVLVHNLIVGGAICSQPASFNAAASHNLDPRFTITSYTFDFGDGSLVYTETAGSFSDGAFDGATKHAYAHAGDYSATLTVIDSNGQSANTSVTVTVTIDNVAPMIETSGGPYVINLGDNLLLNGTAADPNLACGDVLTFQWDLNNDGVFDYTGSTGATTISPATLNALGVTGGVHAIKFQVTDTFNLTAMAATTLTVQTPPSISEQPVSVSGVCSGSSASFSVNATGTNLMYQWRKGGIPLANGANISGADTAMLTIDPAGSGDVGSYDVIVSGAVAPTATSIPVTLSLENIGPAFSTPPVDHSATTDANCTSLVPDFTLGVIAEDNCGAVTLSQSPAAGTSKTAGHYPVRVTATDGANNSSFVDVFFDVTDNTPPSAHAKDISLTLGTAGSVAVNAQDINNGSTDNCGIAEYKIKKAADSSFADFVSFGCAEAGLEPVVLRVKDAAGNTAISNSIVMVNQRPATLTYTGSSSAVYAANVTLSALLQDAATASALAGRVVTFTIGTQTVSATTNPSGIAAANLSLDSSQSAGNYTVQTSFAGDCTFAPANDSDPFAITPSCVTGINAVAEYIGTLFAWTTSPTSSTATLTLSAGLKACTGDIRSARVTFAIRNDSIWSPIPGATNLPVGLVDPGNPTQGTATAVVQYNIGSNTAMDLEIAVIVTGNFVQNDPSKDVLVTIAKPLASNSILGGGEINNLTDSRGYLRGADNEITQFFLNVTYNKKGSNPQGKVSVIVHSMNNPDGSPAASMRTYKISSTAISVLAADASRGTASFSSKATVQDITDPLNPIAIDGGATLQVEMKDAATDTINIYVLNKAGGVWFVNKLDAMLKAVQVPVIATGDIVVK